jgi:hypothetical protein
MFCGLKTTSPGNLGLYAEHHSRRAALATVDAVSCGRRMRGADFKVSRTQPMPSPAWSTYTSLPAISLCCITGILFYRLFLHPLARIPGPRAAAISNVWYARNVRDGCMLELGKQLHKRYGPVVRVGPNEVWFSSKEAFKIIYGI